MQKLVTVYIPAYIVYTGIYILVILCFIPISRAIVLTYFCPHLTLQWAAVTTQYSLTREPPQKWKPVLSWEKCSKKMMCGLIQLTQNCIVKRNSACWTSEKNQTDNVSHLQRHLPGPWVRHSLLTVHNPGISSDHRRNGWATTSLKFHTMTHNISFFLNYFQTNNFFFFFFWIT